MPPTKFKDELNHSKSPLITRLRAPSLGSIHPETNEKDEEISVGVEERCGRGAPPAIPSPFWHGRWLVRETNMAATWHKLPWEGGKQPLHPEGV